MFIVCSYLGEYHSYHSLCNHSSLPPYMHSSTSTFRYFTLDLPIRQRHWSSFYPFQHVFKDHSTAFSSPVPEPGVPINYRQSPPNPPITDPYRRAEVDPRDPRDSRDPRHQAYTHHATNPPHSQPHGSHSPIHSAPDTERARVQMLIDLGGYGPHKPL